jgi:predicted nucleic acid-binding protein
VIVVDSSVVIDWIRTGQGDIDDRSWLGHDPLQIVLGDIVLLEVLRGARDDAHAETIERRLRRLTLLPMLSPAIVRQASANYRYLRGIGITIRKLPDLIIGSFCMDRGYRLMHRDRDFDPMVEHLGLQLA